VAILVRRVKLKNYKSIADCTLHLRDLTLLVGPNGAGKSNFVDALSFISDSVNSSIEHAIRQRGGIGEVRRRSGGHPTHFSIELRLDLACGWNGFYGIQVGASSAGGFHVQEERAVIGAPDGTESEFRAVKGELVSKSDDLAAPPRVLEDRLALTAISGVPPFSRLFDALSQMSFYNIVPDLVREPQPHDSGERLDRSGWNLAAVVKRLLQEDAAAQRRIEAYLQRIVPGIEGVEHKSFGPRETLEFRQRVPGQKHSWRFYAHNMSDGTLRSLGVLAALFHAGVDPTAPPPLIAVEEPESTIHPGAAGTLMDAIIEASRKQQVIVTTHSPDLLDHADIASDSIVAVRNSGGETVIAPVDEAAQSAIRDELFTAGELLRSGQLEPDPKASRKMRRQPDMFGAA